MSKKVGILTFHYTPNYGAVLQAFALKQALNLHGYSSEIIDYRNRQVSSNMRTRTVFDYRNPVNYIKYRRTKDFHKEKIDTFAHFISERLCNTNSPYTKDTIEQVNTRFDSFICGSDQIWNMRITGNDTTFFLDFPKANKQKIAYAASFGSSELQKSSIELITGFLSHFDAVSVREQTSVNLMSSVGINPIVCCDPTLLLTSSEWEKLLNISELQDKLQYPFVFAYELEKNNEMRQYAASIADKLGTKLIYLASNSNDVEYEDDHAKYITFCRPEMFVAYLKNASHIVTNSFHGTILSINFAKQFSTFLLQQNTAANVRLTDLLSHFQLENRVIEQYEEALPIPEKIDYTYIAQTVSSDRKNGIIFLTLHL